MDRDARTRAAILRVWQWLDIQGDGLGGDSQAIARHCGGLGLVVGCPVCGKRR